MKKIISISILLLLVQFVFAQASLEILVKDSTNSGIPGQTIEVTNSKIGYSAIRVSDARGKVRLDGLSTSGAYNIEVKEQSFFKGGIKDNIILISGKTTTVTIEIKEKSQQLGEAIISASRYQTINMVNAEVASELTAEEMEELPIEGRDVTRALYRLPNITQATGFFPEAPNVTINGANSLFTNYQIDGMDNNENFLGGQRFAIPIGFTQNVTALTNNFSAEHGHTSNGIINMTTKSGTNDFSGEVFYVVRPGKSVDATSPFAQRDLSGNQVKDGFQRHQGGFGFGGPLVKDKTFYYINIEHTTDIKDNLLNVPQLGISETVEGTNNFTYISGKIDHNWSNRFRSSFRINRGIVNIERQGGGLEGGVTFPSAGNKQDRNTLNAALKNTYTGNKLTYEANYLFGRFVWDYANPELDNSPDVFVLDPSGQAMAALGHPGFAFKDIENTHQIQQKVSISHNKHLFKIGGEAKISQFELFGGGNPNGSYLVQLNQAQLDQLNASGIGSNLAPTDLPSDVQVLNFTTELRPNSFEKTQQIYSFYVEDQLSLTSKLNINLGARYDYDNLSKGGSSDGDFNNIAPRVSVNYKLSDKISLRAGYGMYYDKILYAVYSDALQFNSTSADYKQQLEQLKTLGILSSDADVNAITNQGNLGASSSNVGFLQGPTSASLQDQRETIFQNELRVLNPNGYDNPYSHQMMIGVQYKVSENKIFYVDVMHNRSYNLFRLRNLNAPSAWDIDPDNVQVRSTAAADSSRPVPIYTDGSGSFTVLNGDTLRGIARNVVMTESEGRSNYYAANFTLEKKKGNDNYAFRLMYTISLLKNNTEDINFRAMDANNFDDEFATSINDRKHLINATFSYYPIKNLAITLTSLLQSGQPINRIPDGTLYGTTDLNGDGRAFGDAFVGNSDRSPGEERNSDRLPWSNTFDLNVQYKVNITKKSAIELSATGFNMLNATNLSGFTNNATQSNQVQAGPKSSGLLVQRNAAPPRQFQFSVRYLF